MQARSDFIVPPPLVFLTSLRVSYGNGDSDGVIAVTAKCNGNDIIGNGNGIIRSGNGTMCKGCVIPQNLS